MSNYAKINLENIVESVIVCEDSNISLFEGTWIKVTEETRETGIGHSWNPDKKKFVKFQIYPSWTLNEETLEWEPPIEKPSDPLWSGYWDEEEQSWVQLVPSEE
jgi:hypothetical protein